MGSKVCWPSQESTEPATSFLSIALVQRPRCSSMLRSMLMGTAGPLSRRANIVARAMSTGLHDLLHSSGHPEHPCGASLISDDDVPVYARKTKTGNPGRDPNRDQPTGDCGISFRGRIRWS